MGKVRQRNKNKTCREINKRTNHEKSDEFLKIQNGLPVVTKTDWQTLSLVADGTVVSTAPLPHTVKGIHAS